MLLCIVQIFVPPPNAINVEYIEGVCCTMYKCTLHVVPQHHAGPRPPSSRMALPSVMPQFSYITSQLHFSMYVLDKCLLLCLMECITVHYTLQNIVFHTASLSAAEIFFEVLLLFLEPFYNWYKF